MNTNDAVKLSPSWRVMASFLHNRLYKPTMLSISVFQDSYNNQVQKIAVIPNRKVPSHVSYIFLCSQAVYTGKVKRPFFKQP